MDPMFARLRRPPGTGGTDAELLGRFVAGGDDGAFAELLRRHGPLVYAVARRRLPDPADAADVVQATFLLLVQKAPRLLGRPTVGPWLYRTAALTARSLRRTNARRPTGLGPDGPPATVVDPAARWDLDDALLALPERDRAAVVLCHLLGHSRREAADRLGLPEGTLSVVLHRALRRLRVRLGRDPVPLLVASGFLPAGVATATARAAAAGWAGGLGVAPGVGLLKWVGGLVTAAGVGFGLTVGPAPKPPPAADWSGAGPRVCVHVSERTLQWAEFDAGAGPTTTADVRDPDALCRLLLRPDRPARVGLTVEPNVHPDRLLAAVRACVAGGAAAVTYSGPAPAVGELLGTRTHDWGRGAVVAGGPLLHLPTTFGLPAEPLADPAVLAAVERVGRLRGTVTRDEATPGRPVVGVSLADTTATDADVLALVPLFGLRTLDLSGTAGVSAAVVDQFRRARPGCEVVGR